MPTQPKPKKPGRPKLAKGEAKAETLRIRVTASELRTFERAAKIHGQTVSEWARSLLVPTAVQSTATFPIGISKACG
jgi:hypothetical protein